MGITSSRKTAMFIARGSGMPSSACQVGKSWCHCQTSPVKAAFALILNWWMYMGSPNSCSSGSTSRGSLANRRQASSYRWQAKAVRGVPSFSRQTSSRRAPRTADDDSRSSSVSVAVKQSGMKM